MLPHHLDFHILIVGEEDLNHDADYFFDSESKQLMAEIKERIEKLNKKGINTYIIKRMIRYLCVRED